MKTLHETTVGEIMSRNLALIKETATVAEAVTKMASAKVSALLVERAHEADAFGILTEKDIIAEAAENPQGFGSLTVHDLASKPVIEIQANVGVKHAVRLMRTVGVRRLLVLEAGKPAGFLSDSDVFRRIAAELASAPKKAP
jgi:predicted transcriptional regulator